MKKQGSPLNEPWVQEKLREAGMLDDEHEDNVRSINGVENKVEKIDINEYKINLSHKIKHRDPSIIIGGQGVVKPSEIFTVGGLPGSGKTSIIEALACAHICSINNIHGTDNLGIKVQNVEKKVAVLDTERPKDDCRLSMDRIMTRLQVEENQRLIDGDNIRGLDFFKISFLEKVSLFNEFLAEVYESKEYDMIIIDGFLDFVGSMNKEDECNSFVKLVRNLTENNECTTIGSLHPNKNTDVLAGHLGAFLYRWSKGVLQVRATEIDKSVKELTADFSMNKLAHGDAGLLETSFFCWDSDRHMMASCVEPKEKPKGFDGETMKTVFNGFKIDGIDWVDSSDLKQAYIKHTELSEVTAKRHIKDAVEKGLVEKFGAGKATKYMLKNNNNGSQ